MSSSEFAVSSMYKAVTTGLEEAPTSKVDGVKGFCDFLVFRLLFIDCHNYSFMSPKP